MSLNIYMGFNSKLSSNECAILIFAKTSKEARKIGWVVMKSLHKTPWPDMAVRRLNKNLEYLYGDADQDKLIEDIPHVVVDMRVCPSCELFGEEYNDDHCGYCA